MRTSSDNDKATVERLERRQLLSAGDLDTTFGQGGKATIPYVTSTDEYATSMGMLPDGSVVAGINRFSAADAALLLKYLPDGRLDTSYGNGGVSRGEMPWQYGVEELYVNPDGSVVGIGSTTVTNGARIQRFTPAGDLDPTWVGPGGSAVTGNQREVLPLPGGKTLWVAGVTVARLNPDGTLDTTFGSGGKITMPTDPGQIRFNPFAAAVQPDGKIVLAGERALLDLGQEQAAVRRYLPSGAIDTSFGNAGTVRLPASTSNSGLRDVQVLPDGRIAVIGYNLTNSIAFVLNPNGSPDFNFGTAGLVTMDVASDASDVFQNLDVQPDGGLLIGGSDPGTQTRIGGGFLARLFPDGSPDWTFDGDGLLDRVLPEPWLMFGGTDLALQGDTGQFVLATGGYPTPNSGMDVAVARFNPDGSLDASFGETGTGYVTHNGTGPAIFYDARSALQPGGGIAFTGTTRLVAGDLPLARLNPNGTPDRTFGDDTPGTDGDARADIDFGARNDWGTDVVAQPDGKLVVIGRAEFYDWTAGWTNQLLVARFNPDGSLDTSFGSGGATLTDFGGIFQILNRGALDADGNILGLGIYQAAGVRSPLLVRYSPDGILDTGFGDGGKLLFDLPANVKNELEKDVVPTADGKIMVIGTADVSRTPTTFDTDRFVARLNSDGTLDSTFGGGDGVVYLDSGPDEDAVSIVPGPGGEWYVGGAISPTSTARNLTVTKLTADGAVDTTFANAGTATAPLPSYRDGVLRMVRDSAGRFVFGATRFITSGSTTTRDFMLVRLTPAGVLDAGFGPAGARIYDLGSTNDAAMDLHLTADDKLVLTGRTDAGNGGGGAWAAIRVQGGEGAPVPRIVGRHVFYNNSAYDARSTAANAADDAAIDPAKRPMLPGESPTGANVTGSNKGVNGVMVDVNKLWPASTPTSADVECAVWTGTRWSTLSPSSVAVRTGSGAGGSDRITITLFDRAAMNTWLRVTVKPTTNTGLAQPDVMYVGNLVGESGDGRGTISVGAWDVAAIRRHAGAATPATSRYDFNGDGKVGAADVLIARAAVGRRLAPPPTAITTGAFTAVPQAPSDRTSAALPSRRSAWFEQVGDGTSVVA